MSSASSAVTYTSVYTDSEPGRPHDPDFVSEPIYPEYIPLEDEHILLAEERPLPPVVSPTAESPRYVAESDPEEDLEEYEDDETEDDEDKEDKEEEEHLAPTDSDTSISLPPEAEVERLLAMPTPPLSPLTSLSPPYERERLARYTAPAALPSPPLLPSLYPPPPVDRRDDIPESEQPPHKRLCLSTLGSRYPSLYPPPPVDRRDDIPESEQPPHKRLCLSTLGSRYEVGESSTRGRGVDYGFADTVEAETRHRGIGKVGYGIRDTWIDPAEAVVQIVLWYLDSECSKHMTGDRSQLINFVQKFLGTVKFRNDHVAKIMGYSDYKIVNVTILRVYFVEGLGHNLFSVGQFCDSNLEVAFYQHTCFIRNLDGVNLLTGSRGNNLYTLSLKDMMASPPICVLSKDSKTKSWLWHRRLSHLNFGAINHLARQGLVRGLPKLKFKKGHLCSACAMGKSKKKLHKPKSEDTNQEKLYRLHMDFCGPMRVKSVNGKKYILVIVDDYSRFTCVKCLRSKDEAPDFIINVDHEALEVIAPIADVIPLVQAELTGSPSSTTVDQDASSPKNDPLLGVPIPEVTSTQSSSTVSPHTIVQSDQQIPQHNSKRTNDHPLDNIIVEPKTYKDALTQSCWIETMQEELNEFEQLEPDGFVDQDNPNYVYKLKKALYGLKQDLRAWYDMLSSFLISQDFSKGSVDPTLFIRRNGNDLLLVQIYVDDIIFAASTP
nr:retrovirus-related Pol polyprotein from transposon TNT 1-94 [Tanacetum cinerariifolium]